MISVDYHAHSIFSGCGVHTVLEMLTRAKELGLKGMGITDHGPELKGHLNGVFFNRVFEPVQGIRLLKGLECNLTSEKGEIDCLMDFMQYMDVILLGIHHNTQTGMDKSVYTDMIIAAMQKNPYIDILVHLNDPQYPVEFEPVAQAAKGLGMVVEINNSKLLLNRVTQETTEEMLEACMKAGCRAALCSDAHAVNEIGRDDAIQPVLKKLGFPEDLIVNPNAEEGFAFIEERREIKKRYY